MEKQTVFQSMNTMVAYQEGPNTWPRWIDLNLYPICIFFLVHVVSRLASKYTANVEIPT
jgi:hypothetical protein